MRERHEERAHVAPATLFEADGDEQGDAAGHEHADERGAFEHQHPRDAADLRGIGPFERAELARLARVRK